MPSSETVAGVRLTYFKAKLLHYIEKHPGQTSVELGRRFYDNKGNPAQTIRAHIHQINEALMDTGMRIRGGQVVGYHVVCSSK